jgi:hypothetical protein
MQTFTQLQRSGVGRMFTPGVPARSAGATVAAPFTEKQVRLVLALREWAVRGAEAARLFSTWPPGIFSEAQGACVLQLLELNADDLCAVLADAMVPRRLRGGLFHGSDFADTQP